MFNILNKDGIYYVYDRKSRSDQTLESYKKIDSLKQHETFLKRRIKELGITVKKWYKEVVSGDSIQDRPEIQKLLNEVENGNIDGVLVVDIDRLARGDTTDQGIISRTFKYTNTKIITLNKVYDPQNEEDEDFFEYNLFFARREYKAINKRQQRGRISSVMSGKFCASEAPYGYNKVKIKGDRGFTLEINENEAKVIKTIFTKRNNGVGINIICNYLNSLGIKPKRTDVWTPSTLTSILSNPVYCGKIRWNMNKTIKEVHNGQVVKRRVKNGSDVLMVEGLHKGIIDVDLFNSVQTNKPHIPKVPISSELKNPLAGLVKCSICGRVMVRKPYSRPQNIRITKYLDKDKLRKLLRNHKGNYSLSEIARTLKVSKYKVDHWFASNLSKFSVPTYEEYIKLKELLSISDDSFDKAVELYHTKKQVVPSDALICPKAHCKTIASDLKLVEDRIIELTKQHFEERTYLLKNYNPKTDLTHDDEIEPLEKEINALEKQLDKAYDLVENGVYSSDEFINRTKKIKSKLNDRKKKLKKITSTINIDNIKPMIPIAKKVIESYSSIKSVQDKNELLKTIIDYAEYSKLQRQGQFTLKIRFKF